MKTEDYVGSKTGVLAKPREAPELTQSKDLEEIVRMPPNQKKHDPAKTPRLPSPVRASFGLD